MRSATCILLASLHYHGWDIVSIKDPQMLQVCAVLNTCCPDGLHVCRAGCVGVLVLRGSCAGAVGDVLCGSCAGAAGVGHIVAVLVLRG
jgi:hypothetical protein